MPWVGEEGSVREVESGCENGRESERGEARGALKMVRNVYVFLWVVVPLSFSPFHLISIISVYLFMFMFLSSFLLHSLFLLVLSLILVSQHFFSSFLFLTFSNLFLIVYHSLLSISNSSFFTSSQSFLALLLLFSSLIPFILSCTFSVPSPDLCL